MAKFWIRLGLFLFFFFSRAAVWAQPTGITLLHFSDLHGHLENFARQVHLIRQVRNENAALGRLTFVLFSGDLFTGTPLSSGWQGAVEVEALNRLGINTAVAGDHEFDFSLPRLLALRKKMRFELISANVLYADSGRILFAPTAALAKDRLTLAVLGLTTPDAPILTHPDNVKSLLFADPMETTKQYLGGLQRADFAIALTHMGIARDKKLLKQFSSIDLILGGHDHPDPALTSYCERIRKQRLCTAPAYGTHVGRIDLAKQNGDWKVASARLIPLDKTIAEDAATKQWLARYEKEIDRRYSRVIAYAKEDLPHHRAGPTPLGRLIARILLEYTGADAALINSGGIRYSLQKGPIRMKDIITILPFNNTLQVLELTGRELKAVLKFSESRKNSGGYLQTAGVEGKKFEADATIKVCTIDFLVTGGDGYYHFKGKKVLQKYPKTIGEIVAAHLKNQHTVTIAE